MGVCCVEGCDSVKDGIVYFEFPTSRSIRRKWLDVLNIGTKVPLGSVVCSQHFSSEEYEVVRGKVRLKSKVVPTMLLTNKSQDIKDKEKITENGKEKTPTREETIVEKSVLPENEISDKSVLPEDKIVEKHIENSLQDKIIAENSVLPQEKTVDKSLPDDKMVEKSLAEVKSIENSLPDKRIGESSVIPQEKTVEISKSLTDDKMVEIPVLPFENIVENSYVSQPDCTNGNKVKKKGNLNKRQKEIREDLMEICRIVNTVKSAFTDPKQPPPDFEDMITNYQIKNSKPNSLLPQEIEIEVPPAYEGDGTIVVDDVGDTAPVFIEIPVDKDNNASGQEAQDCLMVLESVEVELDPSSLMLPERDYDEESEREDCMEVEKPPDKKPDPISLLTSSDEDDVILEEPHIDTVEVSDETDEDDMPLVKLVKKAPQKKKSKDKSVKKNESLAKETFTSLFWKHRGYDYYCMQCNFTTTNSLEYSSHLRDHQRILQVCSTCSYTTSSQSQFARHLKKHKEKSVQRDRSKRSKFSMLCHITSNENEFDKKKSKCIKCGYSSKDASVMNSHVKNCAVKKTEMACDQCSYVATRKSDLKRHWLRKHREGIVELYSDSSCD